MTSLTRKSAAVFNHVYPRPGEGTLFAEGGMEGEGGILENTERVSQVTKHTCTEIRKSKSAKKGALQEGGEGGGGNSKDIYFSFLGA